MSTHSPHIARGAPHGLVVQRQPRVPLLPAQGGLRAEAPRGLAAAAGPRLAAACGLAAQLAEVPEDRAALERHHAAGPPGAQGGAGLAESP